MADSKLKLLYFDARGIGEPIRMLLKYKNIPFEDIRAPMNSIPPTVPQDMQQYAKFGQLPILRKGDKSLVQSRAIGRFLAKKYGLMGKDDFENAACDEIVDATFDLFMLYVQAHLAESDEKKAELKKTAIEKGRERFLTPFSKILSENKNDGPAYMVGNGLTWADLYVVNVIYNLEKAFGAQILSEFPLLAEHQKTIFSTPGIKEYIDERPDTPF